MGVLVLGGEVVRVRVLRQGLVCGRRRRHNSVLFGATLLLWHGPGLCGGQGEGREVGRVSVSEVTRAVYVGISSLASSTFLVLVLPTRSTSACGTES